MACREQVKGCSPALPWTLIFSAKNFSNSAMSMIRSSTGFEQSTLNESGLRFGAAFFATPGMAAKFRPALLSFEDGDGRQHAEKTESMSQCCFHATVHTQRLGPVERRIDDASIARSQTWPCQA